MGLMGFWRRKRSQVTVVAPAGMAAAVEEARALLGQYARVLGVELPPLVVELEEGRGRARVERLEREGDTPCYRLRAPVLASGRVDGARLREGLLQALEDAGLLRRRSLGREEEVAVAATGAAAAEELTAEGREAGEQGGRVEAAGERTGGRERTAPESGPGVIRRRPRRGLNVKLPAAVGASQLPQLREALAQRGLELLQGKPYPASDVWARKLDSVGKIALRQPLPVASVLRGLAVAAQDRREWVRVWTPGKLTDDEFRETVQDLAGAEVVAGIRQGYRYLMLRLPQGIEDLAAYLGGEWLERAVATAVWQLLAPRGQAPQVATQVAVRLEDGSGAELDVVAFWRSQLLWVECAMRPGRLLGKAGRRRFTLGEHLYAGDCRLVAVAEGSEEELAWVREDYGCPVWRLEDGLEALAQLLGLPQNGVSQAEGQLPGRDGMALLRMLDDAGGDRPTVEAGESDTPTGRWR